MVPETRIELVWVAPHAPQTCVSTNSTTPASNKHLRATPVIISILISFVKGEEQKISKIFSAFPVCFTVLPFGLLKLLDYKSSFSQKACAYFIWIRVCINNFSYASVDDSLCAKGTRLMCAV